MPHTGYDSRGSPYYGYGGQISRYGDQPQRGDDSQIYDVRRADTAPTHSGYQYRCEVPLSRGRADKVERVLSTTEVQSQLDAHRGIPLEKQYKYRSNYPHYYENRDLDDPSRREAFSEVEERAYGAQMLEYPIIAPGEAAFNFRKKTHVPDPTNPKPLKGNVAPQPNNPGPLRAIATGPEMTMRGFVYHSSFDHMGLERARLEPIKRPFERRQGTY